MRLQKQVSAFLVNKPGRLARICTALAKEKIDILALTIMDTREHGVLRLVTDDARETIHILRELGIPCTESEVLLVDMAHRPGALARVCEKLATEHVNVEYAYCSAGAPGGKALGVFKVSNLTRATKVLGPLNGDVDRKRKPNKRKTPTVRRQVAVKARR